MRPELCAAGLAVMLTAGDALALDDPKGPMDAIEGGHATGSLWYHHSGYQVTDAVGRATIATEDVGAAVFDFALRVDTDAGMGQSVLRSLPVLEISGALGFTYPFGGVIALRVAGPWYFLNTEHLSLGIGPSFAFDLEIGSFDATFFNVQLAAAPRASVRFAGIQANLGLDAQLAGVFDTDIRSFIDLRLTKSFGVIGHYRLARTASGAGNRTTFDFDEVGIGLGWVR